MSGLWRWPALEGAAGGGAINDLRVEQAVWGKVHGARSDFRWIAATHGFSALGRDLERELSVGIEDIPARFPLWRTAAGVHLAGICYPSRARDASGRGDALEKHLLAWRAEPRVPAALAALALLPAVAGLDDQAWWGADPSSWDADPGFVHDLGAPREVELFEHALEETLAAGIAALRSRMPRAEASLAALFAGLLEGRRPILVAAGEPLPPAALAALLLPLDRRVADRLSVAGWLPSSRPPRQELGEHWDVVACLAGGPAAPGEDPRARQMAAALLAGDPTSLAGDGRWAPAIAATVRSAAASTPAVAPPDPADSTCDRSSPPAIPVPASLEKPPANARRRWWILYDLARDPNRSWLDPDDLAEHLDDGPDEADDGALETALGWLRHLAEAAPAGPAGEQLRAKEDLLRAAILALSPDEATLARVEPFRSGRVPPVLYLAALAPEVRTRARWMLGEAGVQELVRRSRECCAPELRPRLDGWIARIAGGPAAGRLG